MAQYQRSSPNSTKTCRIIGTETVETHTVYIIEVRIGQYRWTVRHRYNDFYDLHFKLTTKFRSLDKELLPKKKVFGNQSEQFIQRRQIELEAYLDHLLHQLPNVPSFLAKFLEFNRYEVRGISRSLAEYLFARGDLLLRKGATFTVSPLQLHSLCVRLKLAEPPCDSVDARKDLSHALDFFSQTRDIKIQGSSLPVDSSNINMNELTFDLHIFKSLQKLHLYGCNVDMITDVTSIKKSLQHLQVNNCLNAIKDVILIGLDCIDCPSRITGDVIREHAWRDITHLDLSVNHITKIDESIRLAANVQYLDLSNNHIETIENLESLSNMRVLVLNNNNISRLPELNTRMGNVTTLQLRNNKLESLAGLSKMYSLVELDIRGNKIKELSAMQQIGRLPVLANLYTDSNPVHDTVDYRINMLLCFEQRANEVSLDGLPASSGELDAIAVRLALKKSEQVKARQGQPARKAPVKEAVIVDSSDNDATSPSSATIGHHSAVTASSSGPTDMSTSSVSNPIKEDNLNPIEELNTTSNSSLRPSAVALPSNNVIGNPEDLLDSSLPNEQDLFQRQLGSQSEIKSKSSQLDSLQEDGDLNKSVENKTSYTVENLEVKSGDSRTSELQCNVNEANFNSPDIFKHSDAITNAVADSCFAEASISSEHSLANQTRSIHMIDSNTGYSTVPKADESSADYAVDSLVITQSAGSLLCDKLDEDIYKSVRCETDSRSSNESDTPLHDCTAGSSVHSDLIKNIAAHSLEDVTTREHIFNNKSNTELDSNAFQLTADRNSASEKLDIFDANNSSIFSTSESISDSDTKVEKNHSAHISALNSSHMLVNQSAESAIVSGDGVLHSSSSKGEITTEDSAAPVKDESDTKAQIRFGHQRDATINWLYGPYTPGIACTRRRTEGGTAIPVLTDVSMAQAAFDDISGTPSKDLPFIVPETLPGHHDAILVSRFNSLLSRSMPSHPVSEAEMGVHVMWCTILAYSNPRQEFPACVYITTQYVQILRVLSLTGDNSVPKLEHYFHIPLPNIERIVIGYKGLYLHLEEAFVGPSGAFTMLTLNENKTNLFVDSMKLACRRSTSDLDDYEDPNILTTDSQTEQILKHVLNQFECLSDSSQISINLYMLVTCDTNTHVHTRALVLTSHFIYIVCQDFTNLPPPSFVYEVLCNTNLFAVASVFPIKGRIENMTLYDDLTILQDSLTLGSVAASDRKLKQKPATSFIGYGVKIQFNLGQDGVQTLDFRVPTSNLREKFLTALTGGHSRITALDIGNSDSSKHRKGSKGDRKHRDGNHRQSKHRSEGSASNADVMRAAEAEGQGSMSSGSELDINSDQVCKAHQHKGIPSSKSHDTFLYGNSENLSAVRCSISKQPLKQDFPVENVLSFEQSSKNVVDYTGATGCADAASLQVDKISENSCSQDSAGDNSLTELFSSELTSSSSTKVLLESSDSSIIQGENNTLMQSTSGIDASVHSGTLASGFYEEAKEATDTNTLTDSEKASNIELITNEVLPFSGSQPVSSAETSIQEIDNIVPDVISLCKNADSNTDIKTESLLLAESKIESNESNTTERSAETNQNDFNVLALRSTKTLDFSTTTYPSSKLLQHMESCRVLQTPVQSDLSVAMTVMYSMTALEITNFFHTSVAPPSTNNEELRHILWTGLVLYEKPRKEIPAFAMLSNRAIYFVTSRTDDDKQSSEGTADASDTTQSDVIQLLQGTAIVSHVVPLAELKLVNIGSGKQTLRIVTSDRKVAACIIRDADLTEDFVGILEALLKSQFIGSPSPALDVDDDDIYKKFNKCNPLDSNIYRLSLSWVSIVYPTNETIVDLLFLIHSHASLNYSNDVSKLDGSSSHRQKLGEGSAVIAAGSNSVAKQNLKTVSEDFSNDTIQFYLICFVNIRSSDAIDVSNASVRLREVNEVTDEILCDNDPSTACSLIITNHHLCLAIEDHVSYPIPDFARAPPAQPCTVVLLVKKLSRLIGVQLHSRLTNIVVLVFAEESQDIVVDASVDHFSKANERGRDLHSVCGKMELMVWVRNPRHRQALLQAIEQQWTELYGKQKLPVRSIS